MKTIEKKKQHIIPACYQKYFSEYFHKEGISKGRSDRLYCLLKQEGKEFMTNIGDNIVENERYTLTDKNGDRDLSTEEFLSKIESHYPRIIGKIKDNEPLSTKDCDDFIVFLKIMHLRTDSMRKELKKTFEALRRGLSGSDKDDEEKEKILKKLKKEGNFGLIEILGRKYFFSEKILRDAWDFSKPYDSNEVAREMQSRILFESEGKREGTDVTTLKPIKGQYKMIILENKTKIPFISGDTPFISGDTLFSKMMDINVLSYGEMIIGGFPLSSKHYLLLSLKSPSSIENKVHQLKQDVTSEIVVRKLNADIYQNAYLKVFSPEPNIKELTS